MTSSSIFTKNTAACCTPKGSSDYSKEHNKKIQSPSLNFPFYQKAFYYENKIKVKQSKQQRGFIVWC